MKNQETDGSVLQPPKEILSGRHVIDEALITTGQRYFIYDRSDYPPEGGIYTYYRGQPFPTKGFPFPQAAYANDNLKRITRFLITLISGKEMIPSLLMFAILPWKFKLKKLERMTDEYVRISVWLQNESYLISERYSHPAKEIGGFLYEFLLAVGMDKSMHQITSHDGKEMGMVRDRDEKEDPVWVTMKDNHQSYVWSITRAIATIFEYDDAYRYRIEDIASETTKEALMKNPRKEIKRLTEIFMQREKTHATDMIGRISWLLSLLLVHPRIKKAFITAVSKLNLKRLQLDNADRYHVLIRADYDFTGLSLEDRKRIYTEFHMLSKCCKKPVRLTKNTSGDTVAGHCTKCFKSLDPVDVEFDFPQMVEVMSQEIR